MTENNANVFLSSMARTDKRFKYYGTGDIMNISLLKMIYKYSCYVPTYAELQRLDSMVSLLQQMDPDICVNVQNGDFFPETGGVVAPTVDTLNTGPTISANSITVTGQNYSTFVAGDFLVGFTDPESDGSGDIIIKSLPANGSLTYDSIPVTVGQEITQANISLLTYTRSVDTAYGTSFTWAVYDDNIQIPAISNTATMTVTVNAISAASSTTIGDLTLYQSNRAVTIITLSMMTSQLTPPYNDPEGDLIDAIRIDEISTANVGVFKVNGVDAVVGDIITREDLQANLFTHEGPDVDTVSSDTMNFSARDEGSQIWVQ
jgi:hypothetical protein